MISPSADPIGAGAIETMAEIGFDYIELSLADMASLPEHLFADLARRIEHAGIRCESCNNFFPRAIRLTGAEARLEAALEYARPALDRAARLGVEIIVFGSSGAKNVPQGFPVQDAWNQIADLLGHLGPAAAQHEVTIAIEPINRSESNLVTLASQGLRLVREVGHPNVQLLIDFYHLRMEREDPGIIVEAGAAIRHLHFARVEGRRFPAEWDAAEYSGFFEAIRKIQYAGRCSIEAFTDDFPTDARRGLNFLKLANGQ